MASTPEGDQLRAAADRIYSTEDPTELLAILTNLREPLADLLRQAARQADFNPQLAPRHRRDMTKALAVAEAALRRQI